MAESGTVLARGPEWNGDARTRRRPRRQGLVFAIVVSLLCGVMVDAPPIGADPTPPSTTYDGDGSVASFIDWGIAAVVDERLRTEERPGGANALSPSERAMLEDRVGAWAGDDVRALLLVELHRIAHDEGPLTVGQQRLLDHFTQRSNDAAARMREYALEQFDLYESVPCDWSPPEGIPYDRGGCVRTRTGTQIPQFASVPSLELFLASGAAVEFAQFDAAGYRTAAFQMLEAVSIGMAVGSAVAGAAGAGIAIIAGSGAVQAVLGVLAPFASATALSTAGFVILPAAILGAILGAAIAGIVQAVEQEVRRTTIVSLHLARRDAVISLAEMLDAPDDGDGETSTAELLEKMDQSAALSVVLDEFVPSPDDHPQAVRLPACEPGQACTGTASGAIYRAGYFDVTPQPSTDAVFREEIDGGPVVDHLPLTVLSREQVDPSGPDDAAFQATFSEVIVDGRFLGVRPSGSDRPYAWRTSVVYFGAMDEQSDARWLRATVLPDPAGSGDVRFLITEVDRAQIASGTVPENAVVSSGLHVFAVENFFAGESQAFHHVEVGRAQDSLELQIRSFDPSADPFGPDGAFGENIAPVFGEDQVVTISEGRGLGFSVRPGDGGALDIDPDSLQFALEPTRPEPRPSATKIGDQWVELTFQESAFVAGSQQPSVSVAESLSQGLTAPTLSDQHLADSLVCADAGCSTTFATLQRSAPPACAAGPRTPNCGGWLYALSPSGPLVRGNATPVPLAADAELPAAEFEDFLDLYAHDTRATGPVVIHISGEYVDHDAAFRDHVLVDVADAPPSIDRVLVNGGAPPAAETDEVTGAVHLGVELSDADPTDTYRFDALWGDGIALGVRKGAPETVRHLPASSLRDSPEMERLFHHETFDPVVYEVDLRVQPYAGDVQERTLEIAVVDAVLGPEPDRRDIDEDGFIDLDGAVRQDVLANDRFLDPSSADPDLLDLRFESIEAQDCEDAAGACATIGELAVHPSAVIDREDGPIVVFDVFRYTPPEGYSGLDRFRYTYCSPAQRSLSPSSCLREEGVVEVAVAPVNDGVRATDLDVTVQEDEVAAIPVAALFEDDETASEDLELAFSSYDPELIESIANDDGVLTIVPRPDRAGQTQVRVAATDDGDPSGCIGTSEPDCDPATTSAMAVVSLTVEPVPDVPIVQVSGPPRAFEEVATTFEYTLFDADVGDPSTPDATVSLHGDPSCGVGTLLAHEERSASGLFTCAFPVGDDVAVEVAAIDELAQVGTGSAAIDVVPDGTAPTLSGVPDDLRVPIDGPGTVPVEFDAPTANDAEAGVVEVICEPPSGSEFAVGRTTVRCTASDPAGNVSAAQFAVTVEDPAPELGATEVVVVDGQTAWLPLQGTDPNSEDLSYTIAGDVELGEAAVEGSVLRYTADRGAFGTDVVALEVCDRTTCVPGSVSVSVVPFAAPSEPPPGMSEDVRVLPGRFAPGTSVRVRQTGLMAGEWVRVVLYSDPEVLGAFEVDDTGSLDVMVDVPVGIEPGKHTMVVISSTGASGAVVDVTSPKSGEAATGGGVLPFTGMPAGPPLALALAFLLAGAVALVTGSRREHELRLSEGVRRSVRH